MIPERQTIGAETLVWNIAGGLDWARARILRFTLSCRFLRRVFDHRAHRLLSLYLVAVVVYLVLAFVAPLWVLILGPILWGFPHLLASLRFVHDSLDQGRFGRAGRVSQFRFVGGVWVAVFSYRALAESGRFNLPLGTAPWPEILAMLVTVAGCAVAYHRSARRMAGAFLLLAPIVGGFWVASHWMAGALILLHNAIAFVYWIRVSRTRRETAVAWVAVALFLLIHVGIFSGGLDWIGPGPSALDAPAWSRLDWLSLGRWILPWATNPQDWFHAVVAFAFGQSLHYFVWLKAIPDQCHNREAPATFRRSIHLLFEDYGRRLGLAIVLLGFLGLGMWAFLSFETARALYFGLAAFHGFFELAGLSLFRFAGPQREEPTCRLDARDAAF